MYIEGNKHRDCPIIDTCDIGTCPVSCTTRNELLYKRSKDKAGTIAGNTLDKINLIDTEGTVYTLREIKDLVENMRVSDREFLEVILDLYDDSIKNEKDNIYSLAGKYDIYINQCGRMLLIKTTNSFSVKEIIEQLARQ